MRILLSLIALSLSLACSPTRDPQIFKAWIAAAPPNAKVLAGYLQIDNPDSQTWTLQGISSPAFARIEMHELNTHNGMMQMREVEQFRIDGGQSLVLAPGRAHLMLKGPKQPLSVGTSVTLTLRLSKGAGNEKLFTIEAPVSHPYKEDSAHEHQSDH